jgi:hypothetical protein
MCELILRFGTSQTGHYEGRVAALYRVNAEDTVCTISVPLSVQCSSGALIGVSFGRPSPHTTKSRPKEGVVTSIHPTAEKAYILRNSMDSYSHVLPDMQQRAVDAMESALR